MRIIPVSTVKAVGRLALLPAAAALSIVAGMAGAASAHGMESSSSLYNGSKAFSHHSVCQYVHGDIGINDTRADGYAVYAEYFRTGPALNRLDNDNGFSSTVWAGCGTPPVDRMRGCTNRPFIPDVCSSWIR